MKRLITAIIIIISVVTMITVTFTYFQAKEQEQQLISDLQYRSTLLAESLRIVAEPNLENKEELQRVINNFGKRQELSGIGITDEKGNSIVTSKQMLKASELRELTSAVVKTNKVRGDYINMPDKDLYVYVVPLRNENKPVSTLVLIQDATYINEKISQVWETNFLRWFAQVAVFIIAIFLIFRWIIYEPIRLIVESIRQTRLNKTSSEKIINTIPDLPFLRPLVREIAGIRKSLVEARLTASEEARLRLEKIDSPWTAERLKEFAKNIIKGQTIIAVSNREPYIHEKKGDRIYHYFPASGMATAIEAIMQATGGEWIAHGSGSGDKLVVDEHDRIGVPPDEPKYTLRRVWLTEREEKGYYYGFSNEGLWPLCHNVHNRPIFRKNDWVEYQNVNKKFAAVVLDEIKTLKDPIIFIQDFHFALLPKLIKEKRPDAQVIIFWHIPWPNAESFSICPFRKELLEGMLGADIIGFHTQLHCNNFIDTIRRELESLIDLEKFAVTRNNHISYIKPFPISIAFYNDKEVKEKSDLAVQKKNLLESLNIHSELIGLGVDRLDYTKGIIERLQAVEVFLKKYPQYIGKFTFIQIAAPSRSGIKRYDQFDEEVEAEVDRINNALKARNWKPIVYLKRHHSQAELHLFYVLANVFLVTSLHDGMNLIAKEFIAARSDERGVLVLSKFAGASAELSQALIVNPYDIEGVANAIKEGLEMNSYEQGRRMRKMRKIIKNHNVYRWSAEIIRTIANLE
jgi:trehalose-6-phosphate synthase